MWAPASIAAFRFGYGFRPGEVPPDADAMLAGVTRETRRAAAAPSLLPAREAAFRDWRDASHDPRARADGEVLAAARGIQRQFAADRQARVVRAVLSPAGFYERLVWFWTDHFTVSAVGMRARAVAAAYEADAIRPHVGGSFGKLLRAAVLHPAMLDYLGQARSVGPHSPVGRATGAGLNENLARELLELHTVGVDAHYTQRDVHQFAELLTGLTVDPDGSGTVFRGRRAEPGAETLLGTRYGGGPPSEAHINKALADLATRPETAQHIARKLAVHFVADTPDPDLVAHLSATFAATGGDLMAVYGALLEHPASRAPLGAKVRQPFDYVVASLRAAGPRNPAALAALTARSDPVGALVAMNQPIWAPPGPNGWPEPAAAWISPPGLTARVNWASQLAEILAERVDPRRFLQQALGDAARPATTTVVGAAAERWEGIALVLASPEFNRR